MLSFSFNIAGGIVATWGIGPIPGSALIVLTIYFYVFLGIYAIYYKFGTLLLSLKITILIILVGTFVGIVIAAFIKQSDNSIFGFSVAYLILSLSILSIGMYYMILW